MEKTKELKRYTLFFYNPEPLTSERMVDFIGPIMKYKFLPQVHKGFKISMEGNGEKVNTNEIWSVDFLNQEPNGVSISLTEDRVDIKCDSTDIDWSDFKVLAQPIIDVIKSQSKNGFSRLAIGYEITMKASKEEAITEGWLSAEEIDNANLREKVDQKVNFDALEIPNGGVPYNYVKKNTLTINMEEYTYKTDYDINTATNNPPEIISANIDDFFDSVISKLTSK